MLRNGLCLLAFMLCGVAQAAGYFRSTDALDELRLAYDSNDSNSRVAYYRGYISGIADSTYGVAWCSSDKVNVEAMQAAVSKYLKDHPLQPGQNAASSVMGALSHTYPCTTK